jgi:hypothetical protein
VIDPYDSFAATSDVGMAIFHASKMRHGGGLVTEGTRYILVGFMEYRSALSPLIMGIQASIDFVSCNFPNTNSFAERMGSEWLHYTLSVASVCMVGFIWMILSTDLTPLAAAGDGERKKKQ